jgi:hypothetical protein
MMLLLKKVVVQPGTAAVAVAAQDSYLARRAAIKAILPGFLTILGVCQGGTGRGASRV